MLWNEAHGRAKKASLRDKQQHFIMKAGSEFVIRTAFIPDWDLSGYYFQGNWFSTVVQIPLITGENTTSDGCNEYSAEASELRLPPGFVPKHLPTTLGNANCLELRADDGDSFEYRQIDGPVVLLVWND